MRFIKRIKNDKGASNTVSFIMIILFIMVLLISFVDVGMYFNVKNQMMSAAENGARSVALYGGTDNIVRDKRGNSSYQPKELVWESIPVKYKDPNTVIDVSESQIRCFPDGRGAKIKAGDKVWCEVTYVYKGIAGKFGIFRLGKTPAKPASSGQPAQAAVSGQVTVIGVSVSEVTIE